MKRTAEDFLTRHLQDNFLDGDKIDDCGGATFTVDGALDIAKYFYDLGFLTGRDTERYENKE